MATLNVEVPESKIIEWIASLSQESKKKVLQSLIPQFDVLDSLVDRGESRIREIARRRGIDWDLLDEERRMELIDEILHESE